MIVWPVLSCNACNTSHLMGIVRTKRVYLGIPSIGECSYMIVLKMQQWVLNKWQSSLHSFKHCSVCALTNTDVPDSKPTRHRKVVLKVERSALGVSRENTKERWWIGGVVEAAGQNHKVIVTATWCIFVLILPCCLNHTPYSPALFCILSGHS